MFPMKLPDWQQKLMDRMESLMAIEKSKPPETKRMTEEGRISSPLLEGSVFTQFKNEHLKSVICNWDGLVKHVRGDSGTTVEPYITACIKGSATSLPSIDVKEKPSIADVNCDAADIESCNKPAEQSASDSNNFSDDETIDLALVSHFLADLTSQKLSPGHKEHIKSKLSATTIEWISKLFRFPKASGVFHDDADDGLIKLCRQLLINKYPDYMTEGFQAFAQSPPVIYIGAAAAESLGHHLCVQLGLPLSSLCVVKNTTRFEGNEAMDSESLEKAIKENKKLGRTSLLVTSHAGTPTLGHIDNFFRLREICESHKLWLHVCGYQLAKLALLEPPTCIEGAALCNSMTLTIGSWLSIPGTPCITLYKPSKGVKLNGDLVGDNCLEVSAKCLPLWCSLQLLGQDGIEARIRHCVKLMSSLRDEVDRLTPAFELFPMPKRLEDPSPRYSLFDIPGLLVKLASAFLVMKSTNPTALFRFTCQCKSLSSTKKNEEQPPVTSDVDVIDNISDNSINFVCEKHDSYVDSLNVWLCESLKSCAKKVLVNPVPVFGRRLWIRLCPLEDNCFKSDITEDDVMAIVEHIKGQQTTLEACLANNQVLHEAINNYTEIEIVPPTSPYQWQGIGAVRYLPRSYKDETIGQFESSTDINQLNEALYEQLQSRFTTLSIDKSSNAWSICLGMMLEETSLTELLACLVSAGHEMEEAQKAKIAEAKIAEILAIHIKEASLTMDSDKLRHNSEQTFLRKVPVFGSLVNWWSAERCAPNGMTFDLTSGALVRSSPVGARDGAFPSSVVNL